MEKGKRNKGASALTFGGAVDNSAGKKLLAPSTEGVPVNSLKKEICSSPPNKLLARGNIDTKKLSTTGVDVAKVDSLTDTLASNDTRKVMFKNRKVSRFSLVNNVNYPKNNCMCLRINLLQVMPVLILLLMKLRFQTTPKLMI